jgi:hypothetical protein
VDPWGTLPVNEKPTRPFMRKRLSKRGLSTTTSVSKLLLSPITHLLARAPIASFTGHGQEGSGIHSPDGIPGIRCQPELEPSFLDCTSTRCILLISSSILFCARITLSSTLGVLFYLIRQFTIFPGLFLARLRATVLYHLMGHPK